MEKMNGKASSIERKTEIREDHQDNLVHQDRLVQHQRRAQTMVGTALHHGQLTLCKPLRCHRKKCMGFH